MIHDPNSKTNFKLKVYKQDGTVVENMILYIICTLNIDDRYILYILYIQITDTLWIAYYYDFMKETK